MPVPKEDTPVVNVVAGQIDALASAPTDADDVISGNFLFDEMEIPQLEPDFQSPRLLWLRAHAQESVSRECTQNPQGEPAHTRSSDVAQRYQRNENDPDH